MDKTKTYLRKRWKDLAFLESLSIPLKHSLDFWQKKERFPEDSERIKAQEINDIDLRGISDDELWFFPNFISSDNGNIDLSFGKGAITFRNGNLDNSNFLEFKFDKATSFSKSILSNCSFVKSKLILDANNVTFENCDFSKTTFKGGLREYGFRRCKFINCNFSSAQWQNTYIRACWFAKCDFTDFKLRKSTVSGFKIDSLSQLPESVFENCDVDGLTEKTLEK